jgi:DNA-binding GntR family transcriptional regulator
MKITQRENAYRHIRSKVAAGMFSVGERIYPVELAKEIGVSLIPVREAISQLQSEGLIVQKPHRGIFVKEIERRDLVDLIEFRTTLECAAAANAARRISSEQLRELHERWEDLCRTSEPFNVPPGTKLNDLNQLLQAWHLSDLAFHMLVFRAAGNLRAIRAMEDMHVMMRMFGQRVDNPSSWATPAANAADNLQVHRSVYDAILRHDPKAARRAMKIHMRRAGRNMLARFDWFQRHQNADPSQADEFPDSMCEQVRDIQSRDESRLSQEVGCAARKKARRQGK